MTQKLSLFRPPISPPRQSWAAEAKYQIAWPLCITLVPKAADSLPLCKPIFLFSMSLDIKFRKCLFQSPARQIPHKEKDSMEHQIIIKVGSSLKKGPVPGMPDGGLIW